MTRDEVLGLPSVVDVKTAARALGIGENTAYELIRAGEFPVTPLRLGRLIKVPTEELRRVLGFAEPTQPPDLLGGDAPQLGVS